MNKKGFTLIELLAVIIVLSVLVLLAVPAIANILRQGRDDASTINYDTVLNSAYSYVVGEEVSVDEEVKIGVCELIRTGYLKQDTKDGNGNLLNSEDYVTVTKVTYNSSNKYESGKEDKYYENYHFVFHKADGTVTCAEPTSN